MPTPHETWAHKAVFDALSNPDELLRELDSENDESSIRKRLSAGKYNTWQAGVVNEWLRIKSEERLAASDARTEAREAEILSIAKEANRLASEANSIAQSQAKAAWRAARYAMYASVISAIVALVASKEDIVKLLSF
ncbi:hypothetical protein [Uliginosibacterium sediminicola]|uniref:Uncharacterized protein n=1 Tax=Uliginosibacterium sediminicola TaxID=2024550 RepID=A0ABU9YV03_9RHOO